MLTVCFQGIRVRYAGNLSEIYHQVQEIGKEIQGNSPEGERPLIWFRGHANAAYNLNPSIFRGKIDYHYNARKTYSDNHLREEYRFQSFMSCSYDKLENHVPQTVIEWQEVMQYFFTKTRLMDWSESLMVSLEFALEAFITPNLDLAVEERRRTADPVIWMLCPAGLNKEVYKAFADDCSLIEKALGGQNAPCGMADEISAELKREQSKGTYYDLKNESERNMNAMISLSSLEVIRKAYQGKEMAALKNFELNPFFYLLMRYYSDGLPVEMGKIPPLAIIHPYHSERIKMQKGVFTVFPYYIPNEQMEELKDILDGYPPIGMEYMNKCAPYLYKIHILNPQEVAEELLMTGAKRGNLYPDMQIISLDMENVVAYGSGH